MPLVTNAQIMNKAYKEGYGVGGFNTNNLEITQAIIEAAAEENSPVMITASEGAIKYAGINSLVAMVRAMADEVRVPVSLHLDHGTSVEMAVKCIRAGFTSVMIDASHHPFEENVHMTKEVVKIAHAAGVSVEAELGRLKGIEDNIVVDEKDAFLTDPDEAAKFVALTGVDNLAVAIGTSHGAFKGKGTAKLELDRLKKIKAKVPVPLVLHGASGVPKATIEELNALGASFKDTGGVADADIAEAVKNGVAKINIDTDMRLSFTLALRKTLRDNPNEFDVRKLVGPSRVAMKEVAKSKMRLFGSSGKA